MNWLKNLKIAKKLLALVGVCILFICLVGYTGYYYNSVSTNSIKELYQNNLMAIQVLSDFRGNLLGIKADLLNLMQNTNKQENDYLVNDIKRLRNLDNIDLKKYENVHIDSYEKEQLARLKQVLLLFRGNNTKIIPLTLAYRDTEAYAIFKKTNENLKELTSLIEDLIKYNHKEAEKLYKQKLEDAVLANAIIVVCVILAALLAGIIGLLIANMVAKPVNKVVANLKEVATGNLKVEDINNDAKDEIGVLSQALNDTVKNLKNLVGEVTQSVESISASAEEMSASTEQTAEGAQQAATSTTQLAQGAQEISGNVEQGASNINKMNKAIQTVLEESKVVSKLGNDTETNANAGAEHVKKAVNKIDSIKKVSEDISVNISELGELSIEIEQIVDLIKNIAGQTNLLALNAAIEAARAGEHGKGFAVVADEVKKLAGQSAGATEKITGMIKEIQNKTSIAVSTMDKATHEVEEGVFVINDAGKALENIISQVKTANQKIQGITKEIDGVAKNSEEMVQMIENISAITEQTAASAEEISSITEEQTASLQEISASAQTLDGIAEKLTNQVSVFKI